MSEISQESDQFLDEGVAAGRFGSRREALEEAVRLLRCEVQENGRTLEDALSAAEWCERFEEWAAGHRALPHETDDSRENIYAGRGE